MAIIRTRLTDTSIRKLPFDANQQEYCDTRNDALRLVVSKDTKAWIVRSSYKGLAKYKTLGQVHELTASEAGAFATSHRDHFRKHGVWPGVTANTDLTLRTALRRTVESRKLAGRQESSYAAYEKAIELYMTDWLDVPLASITRQMLLDRHRAVATRKGLPRGVGVRKNDKHDGGSPSSADALMTAFKVVYNQARADFRDLRLDGDLLFKFPRASRPVKRRIDAADDSYSAVWSWIDGIANPVRRQYFALRFYTGLRHPSAAPLQWSDVDFGKGTLWVASTKRGQGFLLPMSTAIADTIDALPRTSSPFLFPAASASGHIAVARDKAMPVQPHDLRRLWRTAGLRAGVAKDRVEMLGHWADGGSISDLYAQDEWRALADDQQSISDWLDGHKPS